MFLQMGFVHILLGIELKLKEIIMLNRIRKRFQKQDNFIIEIKNALSEFECNLIIDWFNENADVQVPGRVGTAEQYSSVNTDIKDSRDISLLIDQPNSINSIISEPLDLALDLYQRKYPSLAGCQDWTVSREYNIQKYNPGGGYKIDHFESGGLSQCHRVLVWMFYLNSIKGGGTEFPYLNKKFDAVEGSLLIWPAGFTHTHKSIITNKVKYIITGWVDFIS